MKKLLFILPVVLALFLPACGADGGSETVATTKAAPTIAVVEGEAIGQLEDVSVYIPADGEVIELKDLPAYTCTQSAKASYKSGREGDREQVTHVLSGTDAASFITYLQTLEAEGWEQYSNNIIEGTNLFATYTKDGQSLYCYYISSKSRAYICYSPYQNLEVRQQDNRYEAVCEPLLTQVKLLCKEYAGGMSYFIRLSDGRFIIIDGGFNEKDLYHANQLYSMLQEQNVLPKITIAAWIITHPHGDHLGTASDFLRTYSSSQVELQQLILNFPTEEEIKLIEPDTIAQTHPSYYPTFMLTLKTLWPDLTVTVCHTGQRYYFADATLEFLHTLEDYYPQSIATLSSNNINGASTVFTLELGGQKVMFLADCAVDESKDLVKMWGGYLKSDIMQASHHCQRGGTVPLYQAIDPTVVLAPLPDKSIVNRSILSYDATRWLWNNESGNIREIILSGWEQRTLSLPYAPAADTEFFSNATSDPWGGKEDTYKNK